MDETAHEPDPRPCSVILTIVQIGILGPVEMRRAGGSPVAVGGPQVRTLLALLASEAGSLVSRERLIDDLYGEEPPRDARHALQSQISRLRRALRAAGAEECLESAAAGYRLAIDPAAVDAHRFVQLAGDARDALGDRDPATAAALLDEAERMWRGAALADVCDAPFAAAVVNRLTEIRLAAREDRAEAALALGDHRAAVALLTELVAAQPLRERTRALLMRGLSGAGRRGEALELFEQGRRLLAEELGIDPSAELAQAHLEILRAEAGTVPARRWPAPLTTFVGRDDELAQISALLGRSRLVTLTGPGGTGKTRLALEAGARASGEVFFVDLSPLSAGEQIAREITAALGGRAGTEHEDAETGLRALLTDRALLIVLDNCEHLVDACARLVHGLLRDCPGVRVLATSRECLRITGEIVVAVGQLPVADPKAPLPEQLGCTAVRLFADRAAAARPGFTVDAGTIALVRRICARLDGLPLALELAAARLRTLDIAEIDARLADRFRLLTRGDRTAEPRHRTLRAVVHWSWELLDPAERLLARRFAVFAGDVTAGAVASVCELDDADELLADLAEKSLVEVRGGRYRMLETIRAYSSARLAESGEHERLRNACARYYTELAERADPLLRGPDQLRWLTLLSQEHDNLQAALRWAVSADPALARQLIAAQAWYWWLSGRPGDAVELAGTLLHGLDPATCVEEYALCAAVAARGQAGYSAAVGVAVSAVAGLEKPLRRPHLVFLLATSGGLPGPEAERLDRLFGPDPWAQAFRRLGAGLHLLMSGQPRLAEPELRCALAGFRATGDRWAIATTLDKLAVVADWRGERGAALESIDEAVALFAELGVGDEAADLLNRRGDMLARGPGRAPDAAGAEVAYRRAAELARSAGATDMYANALRGLGDLARAAGDPAEARRYYATALESPDNESAGMAEARARSLIGMGWTSLMEGDIDAGRAAPREAFELSHRVSRPVAAEAVEAVAGFATALGRPERGAVLLGAAEALRGMPAAGGGVIAETTARCRAELGEHGFRAAYARGAESTVEEVAALLGEWR
ncbi:BTAD domain-containing putative transcriptional regulator [Nocardia miyunensis]|uniref:BTAD domain-containing putative transcriptional regulator n=1 Tax=Nocardia miyunensis TaxID=282684 RepID=UPI000A917133|nr:BTAD domain-containing putative transcriptional regulator [Nocardia miyunensis]